MSANVIDEPQAAQDESAGRSPRRFSFTGWRADLLAMAVFLLGGIWIMIRGWRHPDFTPGHLMTDHYWFEWLLAHAAYSVTHLENPLFSAQMNYPDGVNLMCNTAVLGIGIPLTPVTLLFGPAISYLTMLTLSFAFSAYTAYYVLSRELVSSRLAAAIAGALYGFAPGTVHHANGQPNFVAHFMLPLIVLFSIKLIRGERFVRNGIILGLMVTYQVFINEEALLITAFACAAIVIALAAFDWQKFRQNAARLGKGLLVTAAVAVPLLAYPLWFQLRGPQTYKTFPHDWGEDVVAFVTYSRDTLAGLEAVEHTIGITEQNTWYGWPLLLLAVMAAILLWKRSLVARIATVTGAAFALLGLGPEIRFNGKLTGIPGIWMLSEGVPWVEMLTPARLTFVTTAAIVVLLALLVQKALEFARENPAVPVKLVGGTLILAALLPIAPWPLKVQIHPFVPNFIISGQWREYVDSEHTLVPIPLPNQNSRDVESVRWAAHTTNELRIANGYFIGPDRNGNGTFGAPLTEFGVFVDRLCDNGTPPPITPAVRESAKADVKRWRGSIAIVRDDHFRLAEVRTALDDLFGPGRHVDDVYLWDLRSFA